MDDAFTNSNQHLLQNTRSVKVSSECFAAPHGFSLQIN